MTAYQTVGLGFCFVLTKQPASLLKREPGCLVHKYTKYLPVLQFIPHDRLLH